MSTTIPEAFITQYQDTFHVIAQQRLPRLVPYVRRKPGIVVGTAFTIDLLGKSSATPNRPRHSDLTYQNLDNSRRFADMSDIEPAELIDSMDKLKLLIEPGNQYTQALVADCNRFIDRTIITGILSSVRTNSGTSALPSTQIILNGAAGLTIAKLRQAKILLDEAEQDNSDWFSQYGIHQAKQEAFGNLGMPSYVLVCTTKQIDNLLATTEATSQDFNTVKALVSGSINTFMGFLFIRVPSTHLPTTSANVRQCIAYAPQAIEYGVGKEPSSRIDFLAHKNSWQVLATASCGAARAEDLGVVRIDCLES